MIQEASSPEETSAIVQENRSTNAEAELLVPNADLSSDAGLTVSHTDHEAIKDWLSKATTGRLEKGDSKKIPDSFWENSREWADKVLPEDLGAEWKLGETAVSERVVAAWVAESDVHRLAKLADQLIPFASEDVPSLCVLNLMTTVANMLGIMRPLRARRLLEQVTPHCAAHPSLNDKVQQAQQWTRAGLLLVEPEMRHRVLWNNRLRNPSVEWSWETPEARHALSGLSRVLAQADPEVQALFQAAVPNFWWDLFTQQEPAHESRPEKTVETRQSTGPGAKLLLGLTVGSLIGAGLTYFGLEGALFPRDQSGGHQGSTTWAAEGSSHAIEQESLIDPAMIEPVDGQSKIAAEASPMAQANGELPTWRVKHIEAIREEFPAIERLHRTLLTGNFAQAESILRGGSSIAERGSPSYRALMKWAVLAPPADSEVRRAVIRLFSLTLPTRESLDLMEQLAKGGEPYGNEFRQMASIMLSAGGGALAEKEQAQLSRIAQSQ